MCFPLLWYFCRLLLIDDTKLQIIFQKKICFIIWKFNNKDKYIDFSLLSEKANCVVDFLAEEICN